MRYIKIRGLVSGSLVNSSSTGSGRVGYSLADGVIHYLLRGKNNPELIRNIAPLERNGTDNTE